MEVGIRRTGNGALGIAAVTLRGFLSAAALCLLASCKAAPQIAGFVAGGSAGVISGNPAVGFVVGVATDAGATAGLRYVVRTRQGAEQDAIAQVAGALPVGGEAPWHIAHTIPIGDEHGQLRVVRALDTPLATCKQVMFSVSEEKAQAQTRQWFATVICQQADTWKWAAAEPAVERWGFLQ